MNIFIEMLNDDRYNDNGLCVYQVRTDSFPIAKFYVNKKDSEVKILEKAKQAVVNFKREKLILRLKELYPDSDDEWEDII